jgi:pimeloyl-ACP methyl ester carboxylesterase
MRLRKDIEAMHEFRSARGASAEDIVVVGHSMGGLLAKSLIQSSGDENWNKIFTKPLEELNLSETNATLLRDMLYFEPVPSVKRVVFISTPHRGSQIAENPIGLLSSKLIDLPQQLVNMSTEIVNIGRKSLTPLGLEIAVSPPTSIDGLRPDSPILTLMQEMPLKADVVKNSIIAIDCKFDDPHKKWSDGVVPYLSATYPGTESEVIIPQTDHSVQQSDGGIAELERILSHHAGIPVPDGAYRILKEIGKPRSVPTNE